MHLGYYQQCYLNICCSCHLWLTASWGRRFLRPTCGEELSVDAWAAEEWSIRILHTSICNWQCRRDGGSQSSPLGLRFVGDTRVWMRQRDLVHLPRQHLHPGQTTEKQDAAAPPARSVQTSWPQQAAPVLLTQIVVLSHKIRISPFSLALSSCLLA